MLPSVLQIAVGSAGLLLVLGSLLSLSRHPHWFVRGWDYPRVQIAVLLVACGAVYVAVDQSWSWYDSLWLLAVGACVLWHLAVITRYTPLWRVQVKRPVRRQSGRTIRMVISNVEMQNREFDRWREIVLAEDPELILAAETDQQWCDELAKLKDQFPHGVFQPQDNMYGMALLSKLELIDPKVEFIVDREYPSIHTKIRLPSGDEVWLHGVHPPPPEPIRDKSSRERDAELVIVGRDWVDRDEAAIIAGDLNDVAWSHSTRLFQRLSGMLDPRIGRGFFNTWDANSWWRRAPLDHVFHTDDFRLIEIRRLQPVGSDHFPMLLHLSYEPEEDSRQAQPAEEGGDREEAEEMIEEQESEGGVRTKNKNENP